MLSSLLRGPPAYGEDEEGMSHGKGLERKRLARRCSTVGFPLEACMSSLRLTDHDLAKCFGRLLQAFLLLLPLLPPPRFILYTPPDALPRQLVSLSSACHTTFAHAHTHNASPRRIWFPRSAAGKQEVMKLLGEMVAAESKLSMVKAALQKTLGSNGMLMTAEVLSMLEGRYDEHIVGSEGGLKLREFAHSFGVDLAKDDESYAPRLPLLALTACACTMYILSTERATPPPLLRLL